MKSSPALVTIFFQNQVTLCQDALSGGTITILRILSLKSVATERKVIFNAYTVI